MRRGSRREASSGGGAGQEGAAGYLQEGILSLFYPFLDLWQFDNLFHEFLEAWDGVQGAIMLDGDLAQVGGGIHVHPRHLSVKCNVTGALKLPLTLDTNGILKCNCILVRQSIQHKVLQHFHCTVFVLRVSQVAEHSVAAIPWNHKTTLGPPVCGPTPSRWAAAWWCGTQ